MQGDVREHAMPTIAAFDTQQELQDSPIRAHWIIKGRPQARNHVLFRSTDKSSWTMLWDCSAGEFNWHYSFDETIHFLEGSVTITLKGGEPQTFGPGDVIFFPAGVVAHWRVDQYIRKLAVCQNPLPATLNLPLKLARRLARMFGQGKNLIAGLLADPGLAEAEKQTQSPSGAQLRRQR
jgi:uncharacterized cupin superfamily protein